MPGERSGTGGKAADGGDGGRGDAVRSPDRRRPLGQELAGGKGISGAAMQSTDADVPPPRFNKEFQFSNRKE